MFHFFVPFLSRDGLLELLEKDLDGDYPYDIGGPINWTVQTFMVLNSFTDDVTIGTAPQCGKINIGHGQSWRQVEIDLAKRCFRVAITADYRRYLGAHLEITQNPTQEDSQKRRVFVPYWPQPGLMPRNRGREEVVNVVFSGRPANGNLAPEFDGIDQKLDQEGMSFRVPETDEWHDMRRVDVLVGVRSFDREKYPSKPPSKLINAWHADVPFIGGWDSAYSAVGIPGKNYIRVEKVSELLEELRRLRDDPAYYRAFVEGGRVARPRFSREAVARRWLGTLRGPVMDAWIEWRSSPTWKRQQEEVLIGLDSAIRKLGRLKRSVYSLISIL